MTNTRTRNILEADDKTVKNGVHVLNDLLSRGWFIASLDDDGERYLRTDGHWKDSVDATSAFFWRSQAEARKFLERTNEQIGRQKAFDNLRALKDELKLGLPKQRQLL